MTPKELYEWAKERNLDDAPLRIDIDYDCSDEGVVYPEIKNVCKDTYTVVVCVE